MATRLPRLGGWASGLQQDVRAALWTLWRSPGYTAGAMLTLTLGIGTNAAMFSVVNALVFKPIGVHDPASLVAIVPVNSAGQERGIPVSAVAVLRDGPLAPLCGDFGSTGLPVIVDGAPSRVTATLVTGQCFAAFGVAPMMGRPILDADAPVHAPGSPVAVISHRLWAAQFGSDPRAIGRRFLVNGVEIELIGVMPPGFGGLSADVGVDLFTPFDSVIPAGPTRRQLAYYLVGRLKSGVSREQAVAELRARWPSVLDATLPAGVSASEREQLRDTMPELRSMTTGLSRYRTRYGRPLTLVLGLTVVLLVMGAVNLGGLVLARQRARSGELLVRLALGGTRGRLLQQLVSENLWLTLGGAVLAIPVVVAGPGWLATYIVPVGVPHAISFAPDHRVIGATAVAALIVALLMSAVPAWVTLRGGARLGLAWERTIAGGSTRWMTRLLVGQVALTMVLVTAALMMGRSLSRLLDGFGAVRTDDILVAMLEPRPESGFQPGRQSAYYPVLMDEVRGLPGVEAVAMAARFPRLVNSLRGAQTWIEGTDQRADAIPDFVSPGFFAMMRIPIREGRLFRDADRGDARAVAIVTESLARAVLPSGSVVGRTLVQRQMPANDEMTIVGVVADTTMGNPRDPRPFVIFRPMAQAPGVPFNPAVLVATGDPATTASGVRQLVSRHGVDEVHETLPMVDLLARAPVVERMGATVAGGVASFAIVLAFAGTYAAFALAVASRRREIGVRMALGATPGALAASVIGDGARVALIGTAVGVPLTAGAVRGLQGLLFGVSLAEPWLLAAVTGGVVTLAIAAASVPASRAARVEPASALRAE